MNLYKISLYIIQENNLHEVSLYFSQENSSIGKKISLTEKIVAVLGRIECPFQLQPHQVAQWFAHQAASGGSNPDINFEKAR